MSLILPVVLLSDNGKEFVGSAFEHFLQRFGTAHTTTAPYHPETNGKVERVHYIIDENMKDLKVSFPDLSDEDALTWACVAYNNLETRAGFSPAHLLYGVAPGETPAADMGLGDCILDEDEHRYANMLKVRLESRLNHLKIKNNERFKRFLLRKSAPTPDIKPIGTWVWICRPGQPVRGPGQVGRSLSSEICVRTSNHWFDCQHSDVIPLTKHELKRYSYLTRKQRQEDDQEIVQENYPSMSSTVIGYHRVEEVQEEEAVDDEPVDLPDREHSEDVAGAPEGDINGLTTRRTFDRTDLDRENVQQSQEGIDDGIPCHRTPEPGDSDAPSNIINSSNAPEGDTTEPDVSQTETNETAQGEIASGTGQVDASVERQEDDLNLPTTKGMFKKGDRVKIHVNQEWRQVTIRSRYCKNKKNNSGSKYNIVFSDSNCDKTYLFDLDEVAWTDPEIEASTSKVKLMTKEQLEVLVTTIPYFQHGIPEIQEARKKEIEKLEGFGAFKPVQMSSLSEEQKAKMIATTWTVVHKPHANDGKGMYKARLCARGDREKELFRTDSPTCSKGSLRLGLTVAASKKWKLYSLDFTSAFVQGQDIERELYLLPPPEFRRLNPGVVWRVVKRVYGLKDAPRGWWLEVDSALKELGCTRIKVDHAFYIYTHKKTGDILGFVLSHVDDFLYGGTELFHRKIIRPIKKKYVIGACEESLFSFTGWNLEQNEQGITVTQRDYLNELDLDQFEALTTAKGKNDDRLNQNQLELMQKANGILGWLAQVSKPDLSYAYVEFSSKLKRATLGDAKKLVRMLKKARADLDEIKYSNLGDVKN